MRDAPTTRPQTPHRAVESYTASPRTAPVKRNPLLWTIAGLTAVAVYALVFSLSMTRASYDVWGALIIAPFLILVTVPLATRVARLEGDPSMAALILLALALKLISSVIRYFIGAEVYDGVADATGYVGDGTYLAESFRRGDFSVDVGSGLVGTGFIQVLTGLLFAVTGPTAVGGFLVFAWLGFWGLYFFYRALRVGFPEADYRRYALLLYFLPSMLYWPSSVGKEAWMMFTVGLSAFGAARVLAYERGGWPTLVLGLVGAGFVRPHLSALVCAGLATAYLLRRQRVRTATSPLVRVVGLIAVLAVSAVVLRHTESYFGVGDEGGAQGIDDVLEETEEKTAQGGSAFNAQRVTSPVQLPAAAVAVLFRPFPTEAQNPQMLFTSIEGVGLIILMILGWKRLAASLTFMRKNPYVVFAAVYILLFVVAFSSFGNFGILARQRVQVFPFVLMFLAMPLPESNRPANRARN